MTPAIHPNCLRINKNAMLLSMAFRTLAPWALMYRLLQCDLDVHAGWQIQAHQSINRLVRGIHDIH